MDFSIYAAKRKILVGDKDKLDNKIFNRDKILIK
jgi:hypothetical protein